MSFQQSLTQAIAHEARPIQRAIAAYLGLAIGDALGATVEFMTPKEIQHQFAHQHGVHRDMIGGGWLKLKAGDITDDTEMSLALGNAIVQCQGAVNATRIAESFSQWMRTKPKDMGNTVRRGIVQYRRTGQTIMPANDYDAGNGACMRCLPIALLTFGADTDTIITAARCQAHITHHNALSDAGTECVIQLIQQALNGESLNELHTTVQALITQYSSFEYRQKTRDNPSGYIVETLQAVFQALFNTTDFESALINVVNRGGDADTTGAILGMIAGALYGIEQLPARWLNQLNPAIAQQCLHQAQTLFAYSPRGLQP